MEIKKCEKCGSENLHLEIRGAEQDINTAKQVALICGDCGRWLKWCPKDERHLYEKKEACRICETGQAEYIDCDEFGTVCVKAAYCPNCGRKL